MYIRSDNSLYCAVQAESLQKLSSDNTYLRYFSTHYTHINSPPPCPIDVSIQLIHEVTILHVM